MPFSPGILDELERVILPQRMPLPIRRQKNAPQIRMIVKDDTEEIVNFTLWPISRRPDAGNAFDSLAIGTDFQTHALVLRNRVQLVNNFERRFLVVRPMDAG